MHFVFHLILCAAALAIACASFIYIFAPEDAQRFLRAAGAAASLSLFTVVAIWDLASAAGPLMFLLAVMAISPSHTRSACTMPGILSVRRNFEEWSAVP